MAELKTKPTEQSVEDFFKTIENQEKQKDCEALATLMQKITRSEPKMWGASIIGFGQHHYVYESGREGDWFLAGFSPRKQNITIYVMGGFAEETGLLKQLGRHKTGKSCIYIKNLSDINLDILKMLIQRSVENVKSTSRQL